MLEKRRALVICEVLVPEVQHFIPSDIDMRVVEFELHNHPGKLNEKLRSILNKLEDEKSWENILLGYGLCSEGVVGLKPKRTKIVLPKTDDCIALFLGSREKYKTLQQEKGGTYYLTKGWIEYGENPLAIYRQQPDWAKKYPPEIAQWTARELMKDYKRIALIDTGAYPLEPYIDYARKTGETFNLKFEVISGSLRFLQLLLYGPWDNNFLVIEPSQEITREMFYDEQILAHIKNIKKFRKQT